MIKGFATSDTAAPALTEDTAGHSPGQSKLPIILDSLWQTQSDQPQEQEALVECYILIFTDTYRQYLAHLSIALIGKSSHADTWLRKVTFVPPSRDHYYSQIKFRIEKTKDSKCSQVCLIRDAIILHHHSFLCFFFSKGGKTMKQCVH